MKYVAAILLFPLLALGRTIPVTVTSASGCPIALSGRMKTAHIKEGELRFAAYVKMAAKNVSSKPILLMVLREEYNDGEAIEAADTGYQDWFFKAKPFSPGASEPVTVTMKYTPRTPIEGQGPPKPLSATARVVYVEFADGSEWGDPREGNPYLERRAHGWQRLQALRKTYQEKGEQDFVNELSQPSDGTGTGDLQQFYAEHKDIAGTFSKLTTMLGNADTHSTAAVPHR